MEGRGRHTTVPSERTGCEVALRCQVDLTRPAATAAAVGEPLRGRLCPCCCHVRPGTVDTGTVQRCARQSLEERVGPYVT